MFRLKQFFGKIPARQIKYLSLFFLFLKYMSIAKLFKKILSVGVVTVPRSEIKETDGIEIIGGALKEKTVKMFGRSLQIREVDTGSCNACEVEANALNNPIYDIERFGISFVASPRHADALLVTGPVSRNMKEALVKTYEAAGSPKIVIAMGKCAIDGGIFKDSYAVENGVSNIIPVDIKIGGCPPNPKKIIYALLKGLEQLEQKNPKN